MKKVTIISLLLFAAITISAQTKQPGYANISGGIAFIDNAPKALGHVSAGVSPNHTFGVGAGIGFVAIDNTYIPLTIDISFFGKPGKITPVIIGSAGYGIYKKVNPYFITKGGFTGSLKAGISLPAKTNTKLLLTGGYAIYSFTGGQNIQTSGYNYKAQNRMEVFILTLGVKI
jgi:hypothetical protein